MLNVPPQVSAYVEENIGTTYPELEIASMTMFTVVFALAVFCVLCKCAKSWCTALNPMPVLEPPSYKRDDTAERTDEEIVEIV